MGDNNPTMLLRDAAVEPTDRVLEDTMGKEVFGVYRELLKIITDEFAIEPEWRYYNDGKVWLFKAVYKKKTIFWLSVWDGYFKTGFFFTEKTRDGVFDLPIAEEIKEHFKTAETTGKLISLPLDIDRKEQLGDFREIVRYKKSLK